MFQRCYTLETKHMTLYAGIPTYNDLQGTAARIKEYSPIKTGLSVIKLVLIALTSQQSLKNAKKKRKRIWPNKEVCGWH